MSENWSHQNVSNKSCSSKLIFLNENQFYKDSDDSCCRKLSLKIQFRYILRTWHYIYSLDAINLLGVSSIWQNISQILTPSSKVENLITRLTTIFMHMCILLLMFLLQKRYKLHTHTDRSFHIYINWRMCSITTLNRHK